MPTDLLICRRYMSSHPFVYRNPIQWPLSAYDYLYMTYTVGIWEIKPIRIRIRIAEINEAAWIVWETWMHFTICTVSLKNINPQISISHVRKLPWNLHRYISSKVTTKILIDVYNRSISNCEHLCAPHNMQHIACIVLANKLHATQPLVCDSHTNKNTRRLRSIKSIQSHVLHICFKTINMYNKAGVGVTKAPFVNFAVSKIFDLAKLPVTFFVSHSYVTGVTATHLWRSLSYMNVVFNR